MYTSIGYQRLAPICGLSIPTGKVDCWNMRGQFVGVHYIGPRVAVSLIPINPPTMGVSPAYTRATSPAFL